MSSPAAPDAPPSAPWPRAHSRTMIAFLVAFGVLLVAFRAVLFPFLMAVYVAYLVEPVIDWATRGKLFGLRWGRGPVLVSMYAVVITLSVLGVSCGVHKLSDTATVAARDLKVQLDKTAPAARLRILPPQHPKIWIPAGLELEAVDGRRFSTMFPEQVGEDVPDVRVLLVPAPRAPGADDDGRTPKLDEPLRVVDSKPLGLPPDVTVEAVADREAKGLELTTERWVIAPVARLIERVSGSHFDPGLVRDFAKERSDAYGPDLGSRLVAWSQRIPVTIVGSLYELLLVLMLTAFIVTDRRGIAAFFESLPPPHLRAGYRSLMGYVDRGLSGVIRGQLVICVVNGLLTWLGLLLLGVPYATLLGFVAGVFSLIPVFGTIASSIPIVLVALAAGGVEKALLALGWISLIHLLEANLLNPLIMGTSAEMHPVLIIFALLAGEHAFGVWGALLAVPTASLLLSTFRWYREQVLKIPPSTHAGHGAWMRKMLAKWKGRAGSPAPGGAP